MAVAQATPALVTLPTATTIAYGQTLASAVLGSGLASVSGTFAFAAPGTAPAAGTAAQGVTFTPTDTANYAPVTASVDVLVIRATPSVTVSPTATSIRAGQSLANASLSGGTTSVPGTFAFADTSLAPASGTASQDVVFTPTDSANYAPVTLSVAVRVRSFDPGDVTDIAGEAGGVGNAATGFNAVGNVLDGQSNYDGTEITVTAVTGPGGAGTVGSALAGTYGSLTLRSDGSYVYVVNDANPTVQALPLGSTLLDTFSYTVESATDSATAALRVTVYGGNDAPTFSALGSSPLTFVNEDTEVSITFAELLAAGNEMDLDGTVVAFIVTSLAGGTLRIGADAASALPWDADSNSLVDATQNAYWTPAADAHGTLPAFAVVARDDGGTSSPTPVTVHLAVTPVNDAPVLTPVEITFIDTIAADSFAPVSGTFAASDVDLDGLSFGVAGVTPAGDVFTQTGTYGTLAVNGLTGEYSFTPNATAINAATTAVSETFPIVVSDGTAATGALLTISIAATDDRPMLSAFESHASPSTEDTATEVSFADLLAAGNEADVDGTVTAFVVTELKSGRLVIGSSAATATEWNASTNHLITSTLQAFWTPDTNAFGLLDAFSAVARDDGGNESTTPVVYRVSVASANDAPSLTSFPLVVGTTAEDTQTVLTFATLAAVGDEADIDGTVTAFVVTAVASGTLTIGGTAATASPWDAVTNAVVTTGLQAYWTPAANASGTIIAFSVVARDDGGLDSPIAVPVSVLVSAVNDPPVNTVPAAQTVNEDTDLVFSAAAGNAISVADVDLGSLPAEVTLTATNGVLTLGSTTGLTFTTGDGTADATLVFTGTRADVNAALAGLTYRPVANFYGSDLLTITTSDQGGSGSGGPLADTDTVPITVLSINDTPTDITLSASTVAENLPSGTTVGTLTTTDIDAADTFTYTLVAGTGDTDNAAFALDGSTLTTAASFDFETKASYSVRVRSTDANGLTIEKPFTITVTNVNEAPTDITLTGSSVAENAASGTTVGTLSTTDVDADDTFTYTLVSDDIYTDNASFTIDGSTLKTAASFDFETKSSYTVRIRTTDAGPLFNEKSFTISVTNVTEPATIGLPTPFLDQVTEDVNVGGDGFLAATGQFTVVDPDAGESSFDTTVTAAAGQTNLGQLTVTPDGTYVYTVLNSLTAVQALRAGETVTDSFTIRSFDGTTRVVSFRIAGASDTLAGAVADGYLRNARVFADANANGLLDWTDAGSLNGAWDAGEGEAWTTTDNTGNFSFDFGNPTARLVTVGGVDISTNLPFVGSLQAPAGSTIINPLTTLVAATLANDTNLSVSQAAAAVAAALGLPQALDLTTYDPLAQAAGDPTALVVQKAAAGVANVIVATATSGIDTAAALANLAELVTAPNPGPVNLQDSSVLASVLTVDNGGQPTPPPATLVAGLVLVNTAIANAQSLTEIAESQTLVQDGTPFTAPAFTSMATAGFATRTPGSFQFTASGYPAPTYSIATSLPAGLVLSSNGLLSGTPAAGTAGSYTFMVTATNGIAPTATQSFTLTIAQSDDVTVSVDQANRVAISLAPRGVTISDLHTAYDARRRILTITVAGPDTMSGGGTGIVIDAAARTISVHLDVFTSFAGLAITGNAGTDSITIGRQGVNLAAVRGGAASQSVIIDTGVGSADAIVVGGPVTTKAAGSASFTSRGSGAGGIRLAAPVQTPLGSQAYAGAVSLVTNAALTAGSGISFGGTVDGRRSLSLAAGGGIAFSASVGATTALTGLTVSRAASVAFAGGLGLDGTGTTTGSSGFTIGPRVNNVVFSAIGSSSRTIQNFSGSGIRFLGGSTGSEITGLVSRRNGIGLSAAPGDYSGTRITANVFDMSRSLGVLLDGTRNLQFGGSNTGNVTRGNLISGGLFRGDASNGLVLRGNVAGTRVEGNTVRHHLGDGIILSNARRVTVGGSAAGVGNEVALNFGRGIVATGVASGSTVHGNTIASNALGNLAIRNARGLAAPRDI